MSTIDAIKNWKVGDKMSATIKQENTQFVVSVDGVELENTGDDHGQALALRSSLLSEQWEIVD